MTDGRTRGLRIGVDVGGTFTDLTLFDAASGAVRHHKTPSTPHDPAEAIVRGIAELLEATGRGGGEVAFLGHGTTVATNMLIERRGAETGLLTTRGFRDVLEIARQTRPHLYDYTVTRPEPLVRRAHRLEIGERLDWSGAELRPLDEAEVAAAAERLGADGVEAVAICFLHAYRSPEHEERAAAIVRRVLPDAYVSLSSEVLPEFREFERTSTTVVNAYVGPRMERYLARFAAGVAGLGIEGEPYTVHSNGGLMSLAQAGRFPVRTCLSGPAAGVVGAAAVAAAAGFPEVVTFDVGGTSTDVSLVQNGRPAFTTERAVAGFPVKTPMVDVQVIGAGGGSIARVDDAGALKVGPGSAGADPGPVAYGRGGEEPTLTDAQLVLGRLGAGGLLGGRLTLDVEAARAAIERRLARPLGLSVEAAALGVVRVAVANIARAIRSVSTERGHDLDDFALFACGGAGAMLAAAVAEEVGCRRVLVPVEPGTMCARGILLADLTRDFVRSQIEPADENAWKRTRALLRELGREAEEWLAAERIEPANRRLRPIVEARYQGQNFEIGVDAPDVDALDAAAFRDAFAERHRREFGYDVPGRAVEIVNCRLIATGMVDKAPLAPDWPGGPSLEAARTGSRRVVFQDPAAPVETPVHARAALPVGPPIAGPAIIEEMSATTVVPPGLTAVVDPFGNLHVRLGGPRP